MPGPPSDAPLVSAIVVNWNGREVLGECLASLFAQTWPRLEVILVDNGSGDGSLEDARQLYGDRLKVIGNRRNEGFARGNNQAIRAAAGEWLFLLNNDAVAERDAVEALMTAARRHPEAGMLACRIVSYELPHVFDSTGLLFYPDGICRSRGWEEKDLGQYDREEQVLAPNGCAAAYRRAMMDEVGPFDESYFAYLEDLDLGLRARLQDWACWYVPQAKVRHRKSFSAGSHSQLKAYLVERNRIWTAVKFLPLFLLGVSPLFTLNRYLLQAYAAITRQGLASRFARQFTFLGVVVVLIRAYLASIPGLPRAIRERRRLLSGSRLTKREWYDLISRYKLDAIELALK